MPCKRSILGLLLLVVAGLLILSTSALASAKTKSHKHKPTTSVCHLTGTVHGQKETVTVPCPKTKKPVTTACHTKGTLHGKTVTITIPCPKKPSKNPGKSTGSGSGGKASTGPCDDGSQPGDGDNDPFGTQLCGDDTYPTTAHVPNLICDDGTAYLDDTNGDTDANEVLLCGDDTYPLFNGTSTNPVPSAENAGSCDDSSDPGTGGFDDDSTPLCFDGSTPS
jgi:hypothetical protein